MMHAYLTDCFLIWTSKHHISNKQKSILLARFNRFGTEMPSSSNNNDESNDNTLPQLSFNFRDRSVPVTFVSSIEHDVAKQAIKSEPFVTWYKRCGREVDNKRIDIHSVELQSVDVFGSRGVGFVKIKADCSLVDSETQQKHKLPGICLLRGGAVAIMVTLIQVDDNEGNEKNNKKQRTSNSVKEDSSNVFSLLVQQPRVPIGQAACLELPAGMLDDDTMNLSGTAVREIKEECGIDIDGDDLVDLTDLVRKHYNNNNSATSQLGTDGIPPSPGGCDEAIRYMYLEKSVTKEQLDAMRDRTAGLRDDHGEYITVRVVPYNQVWQRSGDAKAIICLHLLEQLRKDGVIAPLGELATPLHKDPEEIK